MMYNLQEHLEKIRKNALWMTLFAYLTGAVGGFLAGVNYCDEYYRTQKPPPEQG